MKKDAYYFPHFCNARNDSRILKLRRVLGVEGYGLYFMLLEVLREQYDFRFPISGIKELAYEWHISEEKIIAVIKDFDLFTIDEFHFFSQKLIEYLKPYLDKSKRAIEANRIRWMDQKQLPNGIQMDSDTESESESNKSKANKSKANKNKIEINKYTFIDIQFLESFKIWLEYKSHRKQSYKDINSIKSCYNKLLKLSNNNSDIAKDIVEQSLANNWSGLFPLQSNQPIPTKPTLAR